MIIFSHSLKAWGSDTFRDTLKQDIEQLNPDLLPLQQALTVSSYVTSNHVKAMIINVTDDAHSIYAKAGIFYSGIIMGCNCADDPTPVDEQPEYCVLQFTINKNTAEATVNISTE